MKRRTYLKALLAAGAATSALPAQSTVHPIVLYVDMEVQPKREKELLHHFDTIFKPTAAKQPGYIDVKLMKLRSTLQGKAPAKVNYRFALIFQSEEMRQKWIKTDIHQKVWPPIEDMLTTKDYTVMLFDVTSAS